MPWHILLQHVIINAGITTWGTGERKGGCRMKKRGYPAPWKRVFSAGLIAVLVLAFSVMVYADVFDDFYDYENPDGTYSYYFTQGVTVTLDEDWYQKTMVIAGEEGATFYHKASYEAYEKKGYEGGRLFTIGASVNTDFQKLPSFAYIGFDEEEAMNYFAVLPTDYQGYAEDESVRAEYDALWAGVKDVIAGIKLDGAAENAVGDASGNGKLFVRVSYEDDFSFEIPKDWTHWTLEDPDTLLASADGSDTPPIMFAQKVDSDLNAGDYAVKQKNEFLEIFGDGVVGEPEIITYEPENTDRKLAGFRGVYNSDSAARQYTVLEYVEYFGDDLYHYYCCYVSGVEKEGEHEDETTYFEFLHAIDTMNVDG